MTTLARDLPTAVTARAYRRWPRIYDAACGPLFRPAHKAAAAAANRIGGQVLEVGVGTGLILPLYRQDLSVTGVDISEDMLAKARARLARGTPAAGRGAGGGDIHGLSHPDASYDAIVALRAHAAGAARDRAGQLRAPAEARRRDHRGEPFPLSPRGRRRRGGMALAAHRPLRPPAGFFRWRGSKAGSRRRGHGAGRRRADQAFGVFSLVRIRKRPTASGRPA